MFLTALVNVVYRRFGTIAAGTAPIAMKTGQSKDFCLSLLIPPAAHLSSTPSRENL
jgi:hypothetical protein